MTSLHETSSYLEHPIPFVVGLALTSEQLEMLASNYVDSNFLQTTCHGDYAYALERIWKDHGVDNLIIEISKPDGSIRHLYILGVLPSFDGKSPQVKVDSRFVQKIWRQLGKPPIWKQVETVVMPWPKQRGFLQPDWLYPRMYEAMEEMGKASRGPDGTFRLKTAWTDPPMKQKTLASSTIPSAQDSS